MIPSTSSASDIKFFWNSEAYNVTAIDNYSYSLFSLHLTDPETIVLNKG
jgi:hypothetical protein